MIDVPSYEVIQARRRRLLSMAITAGLYLGALGLGLLLAYLNPQEELYSNTTVVLNLAGPETTELGLGSIKPVDEGEKAPEAAPPPPPPPAPMKAKKEEAPKAPTTKTVPQPIQETKPAVQVQPPPVQPTPAVQPSPAIQPAPVPVPPKAAEPPAESRAILPPIEEPGAPSLPPVQTAAVQPPATQPDPVPAPEPIPAPAPYVPPPRLPGSRISSSSSSVQVPGQGDVPWSKGSSVTKITKSEKGNSSETALGGAQGTVGHNLYVPIYSNLPLPKTLPLSIYEAIPPMVQPPNTIIYTAQERRKSFLLFYEFDGSAYRLKSDVPLDNRERLWQILEDAGYDASRAEYKQGRSLRPVVIGFTVTRDNQLKGVEVLESSGDSDVDRAVLYGFKRAAFWNRTGETVPGRFTYKF
ncbi:MAG TPA: energy transducer TonB [Rectinemataceae bacterium]